MAEANPEARPQAPNAAEVILELSNELGVQVSELPNLPADFLAGVIAASGRTNAEKAAQHLALFKLALFYLLFPGSALTMFKVRKTQEK